MISPYRIIPVASAALAPGIASAYVGPGAGIGLIGALGGLLLVILLAVAVILIWPLRMLLRKRKARNALAADDPGASGSADTRVSSETSS